MRDETILGKITAVQFGEQDGRFGLFLTLSGVWAVQTQYTCWNPSSVEVTKHTKWSEEDRDKELVKIMRKISELLHHAKVENVNDLLNIPIEFTSKDGMLDNWRILQEVL